MKKLVCIMVLACLVLSVAFTQQKQPAAPAPAPAPAAPPPPDKKAALSLDVLQLLKGIIASDDESKYTCFMISAGYETLIAPHFSFCVDADYYILKFDKDTMGFTDGYYFGVAGAGRYYPMSTGIDKFFIGFAVGFNTLSIDGKNKPEDGGFQGLFTSLKVGYKVILDKNLILEPSMSYVYSEQSLFFSDVVPHPKGWNIGLRFGLML